MKLFKPLISAVLIALLAACGGGDGTTTVSDGTPADSVQLAQTSTVAGLPVFYQQGTVTAVVGLSATSDQYAAVGSPNCVDLDRALGLSDGCTDQFDGALGISISSVSVGTSTTASGTFLYDQLYAELTFNTPEYGAAQGSVGATFFSEDKRRLTPSSTNTVAWLTPSGDSRLQQTITFPSTGPLTLTWATTGSPERGSLDDNIAYFRVVLRDSAGTLVGTLYEMRSDVEGETGTNGSADVSAYTGQTLVLSFESRSVSTYVGNDGQISVDNVSLLNSATQVISNGDFQAGASGWRVNTPTLTQNVTSGARTVANLSVRRSVYAPPTEKWVRWADVYSNPTSSTINATVTYLTELGSDDDGIIYLTPGSNGKAITTWDGDKSDRDVAIVFGNGAVPRFTSDPVLGEGDGSDEMEWDYKLTIPPGGRATVIHFIYLSTETTGLTSGATISTRATASDAAAVEILDNFRSNVKYRHGLTQQQIDSIVNF